MESPDVIHPKTLISSRKTPNSSSASLKAVSSTGEVPQILASRNANRVEIWIHNAGDGDLFLAPVKDDVSKDVFSIRIAPNDTLIMSSHNYAQMYKNDIYGFWEGGAVTNSKAMVTEYYK